MTDVLITLPRRAVAQPSPHRVPVGDCGACCLAGLVGLGVDDVYARFERRAEGSSFARVDMECALGVAESEGLLEHAVRDVPFWPWSHPSAFVHFGLPSGTQSLAWSGHARMAAAGGYYGLANVSARRDGRNVDHWVLLCGFRTRRAPPEGLPALIRHEVLVSCPAKHPAGAWVEVREFLRDWGGFNALFARPAVPHPTHETTP